MRSSHIRTHSPQRMHLSFRFLILVSVTPISPAKSLITSESGHRARSSSITILRAFNTGSLSVHTLSPS
jgi:hypothetical protein